MKRIAKEKSAATLLCLILFTLSIFFVLTPPHDTAYADSPIKPYSFTIEVEGGAKFFYITVPGTEDETNLASGLYYNTGENIYLIDKNYWYFYESGIILSADGLSFAFFPWASCSWDPLIKNLNDTAIMFFNNGQLQKTYAVKKVLKNPYSGSYSVSHVEWENYQKRNYNRTKNTLTVEALDKTKTIFDLSTGAIIYSYSPVLMYFIIFVAVLCLIIFLIKRKRLEVNMLKKLLILSMTLVMCLSILSGCGDKDTKDIVEVKTNDMIELHTWISTSGIPNNAIKVNHADENAVFECSVNNGQFWVYNLQEYAKTAMLKSGDTTSWHAREDDATASIQKAFVDIILKSSDNIIGYAVIEISRNLTPDSASFSAKVLVSVLFPKIDGEYQNVTEEYAKVAIEKAKNFELKLGLYATDDGKSKIMLYDDNRYEFHRHVATDYRPTGDYSITNYQLILYIGNDEEFIFDIEIEHGYLIFVSGYLAEPFIEFGTIFELSEM